MLDKIRQSLINVFAVSICLFTLFEVTFNKLAPTAQYALFCMMGSVVCLLHFPMFKRWKDSRVLRVVDMVLAAGISVTCLYAVYVEYYPPQNPFETADEFITKLDADDDGKLNAEEFAAAESPWWLSTLNGIGMTDSLMERYDLPHKRTGKLDEKLNSRECRRIFREIQTLISYLGVLLVIEIARRSIGLTLPILAIAFLIYAKSGIEFKYEVDGKNIFHIPNAGFDLDRIATYCFLGKEGVFGKAMSVMFLYVFLFVVFGAFLEVSGATNFIIGFSNFVFGRSSGGPAKVSVLASGLMGSLSGSAVANALATGSFTIPMMRSSGFRPVVAGGITAAAASGGALVPPIMGAGAYMMLDLIPNLKFIEIAKSALIPAILYYISILLIVHFYAKRMGTSGAGGGETETEESQKEVHQTVSAYEGLVFFGALGVLVMFLILGRTPYRSVAYSLEVILLLTIISPRLSIPAAGRFGALGAWALLTFICTQIKIPFKMFPISTLSERMSAGEVVWNPLVDGSMANVETWMVAAIPAMIPLLLTGIIVKQFRPMILGALVKSARSGVSLVSAAGCVGLVIGVVQLTGAGQSFPDAIVPLAQRSELLALLAIMGCSIILGMGLPSAVCYLLMATMIGPVFIKICSNPAAPPPLELLAPHLFIFYFGMMSMVTPPVALAAYASSSIAESKIMPTAFAAFRFSLVGFTLPYMFYYRRELLLVTDTGEPLPMSDMGSLAIALVAALFGILSLAAGVSGYLRTHLSMPARTVMMLGAAALLLPKIEIGGKDVGLFVNAAGLVLFAIAGFVMKPGEAPVEEEETPAETKEAAE